MTQHLKAGSVEGLETRLEAIALDHLRLATWNTGKDRPARVAFHHDAASTIREAAKLLKARLSLTLEGEGGALRPSASVPGGDDQATADSLRGSE